MAKSPESSGLMVATSPAQLVRAEGEVAHRRKWGELRAHLIERGRKPRQAFLFLGNNEGWRFGDKTFVGEFGACLCGFRIQPGDFLAQPFGFGRHVERRDAESAGLGGGAVSHGVGVTSPRCRRRA